uniref:Uncharacterized protein n=1 Tax=Anguilla anguilla TaxID=7936 RepID=A0A0E9Q059_ANGAN
MNDYFVAIMHLHTVQQWISME